MSRYVLSRKAGTLPATLRALALACAAALPVSMASADAGAKTAHIGGLYDITVAGLVIGKGSMSIVLQGNAYSARSDLSRLASAACSPPDAAGRKPPAGWWAARWYHPNIPWPHRPRTAISTC
ncbi:hypothetical protein V6L77_10225 [Pannonibacter sp. Pt2-lr]